MGGKGMPEGMKTKIFADTTVLFGCIEDVSEQSSTHWFSFSLAVKKVGLRSTGYKVVAEFLEYFGA
jgi:hypothetical protein